MILWINFGWEGVNLPQYFVVGHHSCDSQLLAIRRRQEANLVCLPKYRPFLGPQQQSESDWLLQKTHDMILTCSLWLELGRKLET